MLTPGHGRWRCWPRAALLAAAIAVTPAASVNLVLPTLGGLQLWADVFVHAGWRIQRHVVTGHHRLLDGRDLRRAWGSYDDCYRVFGHHRDVQRLAPAIRRVPRQLGKHAVSPLLSALRTPVQA